MKQQKGITLVALIITIIVMLILVAVTISIALGQNGLVNNAKDAAQNTQLEMEKEEDLANTLEYDGVTGINNIVNSIKDDVTDTNDIKE
ncbi:MAG: type II secretion system protein [Clostridiales bacterium]|nr:type II secretion system protein [Clostridiales bacterium]